MRPLLAAGRQQERLGVSLCVCVDKTPQLESVYELRGAAVTLSVKFNCKTTVSDF